MNICAELENGYVVENKDMIPQVVSDNMTRINRVYIHNHQIANQQKEY